MTESKSSETNSDSSSLFWKKIWFNFHLWEKAVLVFFLFSLLVASLQLFNYRCLSAEQQPAFGGTYREGVVGQPRFLNPLYSPANNPDQDIVELVFAGLMKYDGQGSIIPDLAQEYHISEDGQTYRFILKDNLFWHDQQPLTTDDLIFTIRTIQNPDYKSPLRAGWLGVELEKISDREIKMKLDAPYASFLETATTKIIPRHIWKETPALTFPLAVSSTLSFIGSGPYRFESLDLDNQKRVQALNLEFFDQYHLTDRPYISRFVFRFYEDEDSLLKAAQRDEVDGFSLNNPGAEINSLSLNTYRLSMPRYFSVFFNPENSQLLAVNAIRKALQYSLNQEELIQLAAPRQGYLINSPILPDFYDFRAPDNGHRYEPAKAAELLDGLGYLLDSTSGYRYKQPTRASETFQSDLKVGSQGDEVRALQECLAGLPDIYPEGEATGYFGSKTKEAVIKFQETYSDDILAPWGFSNGTGVVSRTTRNKLNGVCFQEERQSEPLEFTLTTIDQPHLNKLAQALQEQWREAGIKVNIRYLASAELENEAVNPRDYEALLLGQVLGAIPDPLPFWHSSRKREPGVNLALYENEQADRLLEQARSTMDPAERQQLLEQLQDILLNDAPAIFLYQLDYLHFVSSSVQGYNVEKITAPSKRFSTVTDWYTKTRPDWGY